MQITVNGVAKNFDNEKLTVSGLIVAEQVKDAAYVNVQLNGTVLPRDEFDTRELADGDEVNYLHFMGGGELTEEEIERYSRHIILDEVGGVGQEKIKNAKVLVIGAGGLGSPVLLYLAAAGVGTLGIIDGDVADTTNLQRQVLHFTPDVGKPKVDSAAEKIAQINPNVKVEKYKDLFTIKNARELVDQYDIIVDGTDNFQAKFLANDVCVMAGKPLIHAGILRFEGQIITIVPGEGPCYRCLFGEPPPAGLVPSCREAGILGAVAGVLGTLQATEALKLILDIGEPLVGRLLTWKAREMEFRTLKVARDPKCAVCSDTPTITELSEANYGETPVCNL